jgi:CRISPR-associated endonuclease/helicase Cas3
MRDEMRKDESGEQPLDMNVLLRLWGKTGKEPGTYHPLLFHMLDTAYVAHTIWCEVFNARLRQRMSRDLGLPEDRASAVIALAAGLHDLGKAAPGFQSQRSDLAARLPEAGLRLSPYARLNPKPHGWITVRETERILPDIGYPRSLVRLLAGVAGAHHGTFPPMADLARMGEDTLGDPPWAEARTRLVRELAACLLGADIVGLTAEHEATLTPGLVSFIAGLVSVSDWIASSEHFPPVWDISIASYALAAPGKAYHALAALGWLPPIRPGEQIEFSGLFSFQQEGRICHPTPNVLQQQVIHVLRWLSPPYLLIVEAPMGQGKTEAAIYAADLAMCLDEARGFYVALPTQATSNAMHRRVRDDYLAERGHSGALNLQLVHANALSAREFQQWRLHSVQENSEDDAARVSAETWFTARKRPLLAPFGVGTIDQSLLSVLQARHWFVRLFGLTNKVVIFDEVHAYDTYMTAILERLLEWLAAVGSTVVLLSATLPASRRERLIRAYGRKQAHGNAETLYPRLTWTGPQAAGALTVPVSEDSRRVVAVKSCPNEVEALAAQVRDALSGGGCAAVICNTVARAQQVYVGLKNRLEDTECHLFHARTPSAWHRNREGEVLSRFGKDGCRPVQAVLVATQVVEQSLDLDFDWMASEMAPVDLVFQRIGRMHRHIRERPPKLRHPRFLIVVDDDAAGGPPDFGASASVYDRYVLLCSWLVMRGRSELRLPEDIEALVEQVYDERDRPEPPETWAHTLAEAKDAMGAKRGDAERRAEAVLVAPPDDWETLLEQPSRDLQEDDDPAIHETLRAATRLGPPSVQVICLEQSPDGATRPVTGGDEVHLEDEPSLAQTMELLEASLALSHRRLFHSLCDLEIPRGWRRSAHLRFHRPLTFHSGRAELAGYTLTIDTHLGLVIEGGVE